MISSSESTVSVFLDERHLLAFVHPRRPSRSPCLESPDLHASLLYTLPAQSVYYGGVKEILFTQMHLL